MLFFTITFDIYVNINHLWYFPKSIWSQSQIKVVIVILLIQPLIIENKQKSDLHIINQHQLNLTKEKIEQQLMESLCKF